MRTNRWLVKGDFTQGGLFIRRARFHEGRYYTLIIVVNLLLGEEASPSIENTLWRVSTMFTRPAITPPVVYRFGWNLEYSQYIGAGPDRFWVRSAQKREREIEPIFCELNNARLRRFPVSQISRNLRKRRGAMSPWILSGNIFENLPVRGLFLPKTKKQILGNRLQRLRTSGRDISEMITNLGKSWQVGQPTECWLSICTLGIKSKSFPWPAGCVQETTFLDIAGSYASSDADVMSQSHSHFGAINLTLTLYWCTIINRIIVKIK